ncbi:hypothetical protein [Orrella marina]|uniref:Uncharacterized protein n=1 Tax=Orrella marina TaxID=2163011 RepID=A0A2R4XFQ7_9BURK|nr:hypothetical protein [Orrella marina]AWB32642.1 hypothetical protein DBV39_01750 [Orrella marina]
MPNFLARHRKRRLLPSSIEEGGDEGKYKYKYKYKLVDELLNVHVNGMQMQCYVEFEATTRFARS